MIQIFKNILLTDQHAKPIATDIFYEANGQPKPVIIYAHGFNGFKDWGAFDLIARQIAEGGFVFIKFNFSHNGTTPEQPEAFTDLEAYAQNNYSIELDNLQAVIEWATNPGNPHTGEIDASRLGLIGHSLGGGITILKAAEEDRVKALVTWASIATCQTPWTNWPADRLRKWAETGVEYVVNGRTGQQMPLGYQLYLDYEQHRERLSIERAIRSLTMPVLLCHGTHDPAVPFAQAQQLQAWQPQASLLAVDSDHVFGRRHPWTEPGLPKPMQEVLDGTVAFFKEWL